MTREPICNAENYSQACELLRSGLVKHVRLGWQIGGDEFFQIASDWCDAGAKIKKYDDCFVISVKGFPIPRQS